jgi:hypothetical protein
MKDILRDRPSERGSAGVKFVIVLSILILAAHAGYNYIPVAYQAASMKSDMETAVLQGIALPGKMNPIDNVKVRVQQAIVANQVPADATLAVTQQGNAINAHLAYTKAVSILPFGLYTYQYKFDHTATPTGFLLKQ